MTLLTGEPRFDLHHATITALLELIALDNCPTNSAVASESQSPAFGGSEPGHQNAPASVKAAERALERCEKELARIHASAKVRERHEHPAQKVAGVDVSAPEGITVPRRESEKRGAYMAVMVRKLTKGLPDVDA